MVFADALKKAGFSAGSGYAPSPGAASAPPPPGPAPAPGAGTFCSKVFTDIPAITDEEYAKKPVLVKGAAIVGKINQTKSMMTIYNPEWLSTPGGAAASVYECNLIKNIAGENAKCDELRQRFTSAKSCFERDAAGARKAEVPYAGPNLEAHWTGGNAPAGGPAGGDGPKAYDDRTDIKVPTSCNDLFERFGNLGPDRVTNDIRENLVRANWGPSKFGCGPAAPKAGEGADCDQIRARWNAAKDFLEGKNGKERCYKL